MKFAATVAALAVTAEAKTYFSEKFESGWEKKWTVGSEWKSSSEMGDFKWTGGEYGAAGDKGIQTSQDARFYSITAPLDAEVDNKGKDLIISYTVKHEQDIDCGGAYIKLLPGGFNAKKFGGDTPYAIMFGPDICGYSTRKSHVIFTYNDKNLLTKKNIRCETDRLSHRYTLVVRPDNTYEVQIDGTKVESGELEADFDFLAPKMIKDPKAKKPSDWVDDEMMVDPEDKKPAGWDDEPEKIPDPDAKKPEDWDDEEDGEWEPSMIPNPNYKGSWEPKKIKNPNYKGPWIHPEIENPEYKPDDSLYNVCKSCSAVGFELWQVKSGTIFDDIIVTDSLEEADAFSKATFEAKRDEEKKKFDALEEARKAEEAKKAAESAKSAPAATEDDEDEDDEDDKDEL